ncbi:fasciclin domain-containing protein [Flammeovirgaceae bacterium SG7u.111]|nr:fasciclin domain-containing protein [Flammeovirgaceae bacterium SG7u.132]WPO38314.1 fasciclin domain-containing protein [Flammeovirgaceae bacterium SG7u.111]
MKTFQTLFTVKNWKTVLFLLFSLTILSACNDEEDDMPPEEPKVFIADVVGDDNRFTTLLAALNQADLASTFAAEGTFTVFAPTDEAFEAYLTKKGLTADQLLASDQLDEILKYHVVSGTAAMSTDLTNGAVPTLNGDAFVNVNNGVIINGIATVTQADVETDNGIIHVIDNVLEPASGSIVEIAVGNPNFSTLVSLLQKYDLVDALSADGPYTVFAPTNEAFKAIETAIEGKSDAEIKDILLFHVIGARAFSSDLSSTDFATLNARKPLSVDLSSGITLNNQLNVQPASANILATNGVIHVVDEVLLPKRTVVDVALYNESFSSLVAALTKAELVETLDMAENITVFAPTNTALDAAIQSLGFSGVDDPTLTKEALTPILTYHVLGLDAPALSSDLVDGKFYPTLNGGAIKFDANGLDLVDANDNMIPLNAGLLDIEESNGVVHVIDGVLLPPSKNIVEVALGLNPEFSTLVSLLQRVSLEELLDDEGPFTVFAPTNKAFEDLGINPDDLTDAQLTEILSYHVVSGRAFSTDLSNGDVQTLLTDAKVTVEIGSGVVLKDGNNDSPDATVIIPNVQATNGVIHAIDKVILPN